jgi:hypothetical protein
MLAASLRAQSPDARVWAHALVYAAARGIVGMRLDERELILAGNMMPLRYDATESDLGKEGSPCLKDAAGGIIMPHASKRGQKITEQTSVCHRTAYHHHLNFVRYSLCCPKFNAFRLYLYIESVTDADGRPRVDIKSSIDFLPDVFRVISIYYIIQYHKKSSRRMPGLFRCVREDFIFPSLPIVHETYSRTGGFA